MTQTSNSGGQGGTNSGNTSGNSKAASQPGVGRTGNQKTSEQTTSQAAKTQAGTKPSTPNPVSTPGRNDQETRRSDSNTSRSPAALPGIEVNPTNPAETSPDADKAYGPGGGRVLDATNIDDDDTTPELLTPEDTDGIKGLGQSHGQRTAPGADTKPL